MSVRVLVTGAGGFIGHHLVALLVRRGYCVRWIETELVQTGTIPERRRTVRVGCREARS